MSRESGTARARDRHGAPPRPINEPHRRVRGDPRRRPASPPIRPAVVRRASGGRNSPISEEHLADRCRPAPRKAAVRARRLRQGTCAVPTAGHRHEDTPLRLGARRRLRSDAARTARFHGLSCTAKAPRIRVVANLAPEFVDKGASQSLESPRTASGGGVSAWRWHASPRSSMRCWSGAVRPKTGPD